MVNSLKDMILKGKKNVVSIIDAKYNLFKIFNDINKVHTKSQCICIIVFMTKIGSTIFSFLQVSYLQGEASQTYKLINFLCNMFIFNCDIPIKSGIGAPDCDSCTWC